EFTRFMDGELRLLMWIPPQRSATGLQIVSRPGAIQPAHATAAGKVWLASLGNPELRAFVWEHPLPRLGPGTIVDPETLLAEVEGIRESGYAVNREEDGE